MGESKERLKDGTLVFHKDCGYGVVSIELGSPTIQYNAGNCLGYTKNTEDWIKATAFPVTVPPDLYDEIAEYIEERLEEIDSKVEPPRGTRIKISESDLDYHVYFHAAEKWIDEDGCVFSWNDLKYFNWEEV